MKKLERRFYERPTLEVARDLLGKYMIHETNDGRTVGKIVEVEAYVGSIDAACHAYNNKCTNRTKIMFGEGGHAYVYLIYGMHYCMNIVTNQETYPEAVLIRALEPVEGLQIMKRRRKTESVLNLCSGPGKLCQAMGITKLQNEIDLCGGRMFLLQGETIMSNNIGTTPRINIDYAKEARDYPWRFIVKDSPFVSKGK
ncbi:DNA-3-methyladenine glycosylase [Pelosinus propionicus]|uniref:Putative 3-methyladenine DNA glycosylase n=1 Tax=Pelosinus propionicus DSM 13327 TaxID=1123291 RepID=A0A1I4NVM0_9FIRM|nr:DNA-3-methyladenine glycosylase [Pelosinus propionicus]SFM19594.1 DNA-3-methyladenine glycosylase [Pelosinus propionicus DSM 13327]